MKKITYLILLFTGCLFAQISDEQKHLEKIEEIEEDVKAYAIEHRDEIAVPENFLQGLKEEGLSKKEQKLLIEEYKTTQLRKAFFVENPDLVSAYESNYLLNGASVCDNGGFEQGAADYSFFQHEYSGPVGQEFDDCEMGINKNIPIALGSTNDINAPASLVTPGVDPVLTSLSPPVNLQRTNSNNPSSGMAVRLNSNSGGADITTMVKNRIIAEDEFIFNFAMVLENPTGHGDNQPFFEVRIYDENDNLFDSYCVIADTNDCIFIDATPNISNKILYSEWSCAKINTAPLSGQSIRVEFSVADCGLTGHFGYVYIDDLCEDTCDSPAFGYLNLDPLDTPEPCPEFPIQVCGEFDAPLAGTPQEGNLVEMRLDILDDNQIVGGTTNVSVDVANGIFCFTLHESDFPSPLVGDFDFSVNMDFEMFCNLEPYIYTLTDTATNNFGADISCTLWPRTYGGGQSTYRANWDVVVDEDDNVYSVGEIALNDISHEDSNFNSTGKNFIMKHDKYGSLIWIRYFPDNLHAIGGQLPIHLKLTDNKLVVITNKSYLLIYDLDGNFEFQYQVGPDYTAPYYIDVDSSSNMVYVARKFTENFSNSDYTITASLSDSKCGIFKFNINDYMNFYEDHTLFDAVDNSGNGTSDASIYGLSISESNNKVFVSGYSGGGDKVLFPSSQQITDSYFGVEYDISVGFNFVTAESFSNPVGLLEYDDYLDFLYVDRNGISIDVFQFGFQGTVVNSLNYSGYGGNIRARDFYINQQSHKLYVVLNNWGGYGIGTAIAKLNAYSSGFEWEIPILSPSYAEAIAVGSNDYVYITGRYNDDTSLGTFSISKYNGSTTSLDVFLARLKDLGNDAIFAKPSGEEETLAVIEGEKDTQFTIYPNPAKSQLIVEVIENLPKNTLISVVDIQGRSVKVPEKEVITLQTTLNVEHLAPGVYILMIVSEEDSTAEYHRFIKE